MYLLRFIWNLHSFYLKIGTAITQVIAQKGVWGKVVRRSTIGNRLSFYALVGEPRSLASGANYGSWGIFLSFDGPVDRTK